MSRWIHLAAAGLLLACSPAAAQELRPAVPDAFAPPVPAAGWAVSPAARSAPVTPEVALPGAAETGPGARGLAPLVGGVVGLAAGALAGRWLMQRNCTERCGEKGFYGLLGGGVIGFSAGFTLGRVVAGERPPSSRPPIPTRTP